MTVNKSFGHSLVNKSFGHSLVNKSFLQSERPFTVMAPRRALSNHGAKNIQDESLLYGKNPKQNGPT